MPERQDLYQLSVRGDLKVHVVPNSPEVDTASPSRLDRRTANEGRPILEQIKQCCELLIESEGRLLSVLQPAGPRLVELPERAGHDANCRDGSPPGANLVEGPTCVDALSSCCLRLPLTDEAEFGLTQSYRFIGVLDPNGNRCPLLKPLTIVEHDCALDDLAGVKAHRGSIAHPMR